MALNPHQRNKVDVSSMTEEEQKLFRLYGKLPNKKDLLQNKLKVHHLASLLPLPPPPPPVKSSPPPPHLNHLPKPPPYHPILTLPPHLPQGQERKYFDSGDYALSKAGKASDVGVTSIGREHPSPENIPHLTQQNSHPGSTNNAANSNNGNNSPSVSTSANPNVAGLSSPGVVGGTSPPNSAMNAPSQIGSSLNPRVSNTVAGAEDAAEGVVSGGQ
ncbi:MAG: hypothetical protein Q9165_004318 [Trypethelium subeluteriae]